MYKSLFLLLCLILSTHAHSQIIKVTSESPSVQLYDLTGEYSVDLHGHLMIENLTSQEIYLDVTQVELTIPSSWDIDEGSFTTIEGPAVLSPRGAHFVDAFVYLITDEIEDVDIAVHKILITATDQNGNILEEIEHLMEYEIFYDNLPSPTFEIRDFSNAVIVDTILIPIELPDPFSREFFAYAEFVFDDFWNLDRKIIWEPIELISENIEITECFYDDLFPNDPELSWCKGDTISWISSYIGNVNFNGTLAPTNDYRYEILFNVYDPADRLNSNQQIRFIARNAACVYGYEADIISYPDDYIYLCEGSSISLNARPEFGEVTWTDQNGNGVIGSEVNYVDIQENVYIEVRTTDSDGCIIYDYITILIEERYEEFVDTPTGNSYIDACPDQVLDFSVPNGYEDVIWYDEQTGNTYFGNSLSLNVGDDYFNLEVRAKADDGCKVRQTIYISVNPMGLDSMIVEEGHIRTCLGGTIELSASTEFSNVTWTDEESGAVYTGQNIEIQNVTEFINLLITATSDNSNCNVFQYITIIPEISYANDIMDEEDFAVCEGADLMLVANSTYTNVTWQNSDTGDITSGQELLLQNVTDYFQIHIQATASDGCLYEQYINIYPENEEIYDENILITDLQEVCRKLTLVASDDYSEIQWRIYNFQTNQYDLVENIWVLDLDYSDQLETQYAFIELRGKTQMVAQFSMNLSFHLLIQRKEN